MTETKQKRQGQKGATPRPLCPECGDYIQVVYKRKLIEGKRILVPVGEVCDSDTCPYIKKEKKEKNNIWTPKEGIQNDPGAN